MRNPEKGDIVKVLYNFSRERGHYPYNYPHKGDYEIVVKFEYNSSLAAFMLWIDRVGLPIPLYMDNFELVQDEADGDEILNEAYKIANNL